MSHTLQPSRQSTDIRQASLVEAALLLATQRSPANITTGDLAAAVGITQGAVFRHFASKEAIWLAVLGWVSEHLMERLHAAAQAHQGNADDFNPLSALKSVYLAHVDFMVAHPGVPRIIFQELQHAQQTPLKIAVQGLMQQYRTLVMALLQSAQAKGLLANDIDLPCAAVLFLGSVQGLIMQSLVSGHVQAIAAQAPGVFAIFFRGIVRKESP